MVEGLGNELNLCGTVANIERYRIHDGDGIRTNIFLKGCPLYCPWCCNPETQSMQQQMAVFKKLCKLCGMCVHVCPNKAIHIENEQLFWDESKCDFCGKCVAYCPHKARKSYGKTMTVQEVINEVEKDALYYNRSGGGITVSGGEPGMQSAFTRAILHQAKNRYIHTAIETSGAVPAKQLWEAAEYADTILIDLKFTDAEKFKIVSAFPYEEYLKNLSMLCSRGKEVVLRCPIIPGKNSNSAHIEQISAIALANKIPRVDLLAFHQLGKNKYEALGMNYEMSTEKNLQKEDLEPFKSYLEQQGLNVTIGG